MKRLALTFVALMLAAGTLANAGCFGKPVKILVRKLDTGKLALDGRGFHLHVTWEAGKDEFKDSTMLVTNRRLKVEDEYALTVRSPTETAQPQAEWKKDPRNFDYLINWTIESDEQTKFSFADPLKIAVKETWKIEKVSQPSVTRTWNCSYLLHGGASSANRELAQKAVKTVVAPARMPIINEIKAFVASH